MNQAEGDSFTICDICGREGNIFQNLFRLHVIVALTGLGSKLVADYNKLSTPVANE